MTPAPFFAEAARGPNGGCALWATAEDGTRLRLGHWPTDATPRGTVLLFPGRSEYLEKYGPTAAHLTAAGFHVVAIDWRGQGLSTRRHAGLGHIEDFAEYQQDVAALLAFVTEAGLPRPLHLLSHSMGGCIALRSLMTGLEVARTVFSAPMWGYKLFPGLEPVAVTFARLSHQHGRGMGLTPTTTRQSYVLVAPFRGNLLTRDPEMFGWMRHHLVAHPELALGGPTVTWLHAGFTEMGDLARRPSPALPCLIALGTHERIICPRAIRRRVALWPGAKLELYPRAEHEVMMEVPATRDRFHADMLAFLCA